MIYMQIFSGMISKFEHLLKLMICGYLLKIDISPKEILLQLLWSHIFPATLDYLEGEMLYEIQMTHGIWC